jgi:peptidylprolyl isomerase
MLMLSPTTPVASVNRMNLSKEVSVRRVSRVLSVAIATAVTASALVGCSASPESCVNPLGTGSADQVSVSGSLGSAPVVDFPTPFVGRDSSISTVIAADEAAPIVRDGYYVDFEATVYAGTDKTVLTSTAYGQNSSEPQRLAVIAGSSALSDAFLCQREGERFTLAGTTADIFGAAAGGSINPTETVVVVFDVMNVFPRAASGIPQFGQDGMPAVTTAPDGRPGIAVPNTAPPADLRIATLTKGHGDVVTEGQTVVAHYLGVIWGGGVFDTTWDSNRPANLVAQSFIDNGGEGVVPGFAKALVGQTVGSRVLVSIPPAEGYPAGQEPTSIPANATMIFVIDILGTK